MGVMKISFGNMKVKLNIFHIRKQPLKYDEVQQVCLIKEIMEEIVEESSIEDPLEACFIQFEEDLDLDKLIEQADVILENAPLVSSEKEETVIPDPPKKELKPLPDTLKYMFLGLLDSLHVIIALDLFDAQEEKLLEVLREHKETIGWTIEDIKGINLSVVMHKIHLNYCFLDGYSGYNQVPVDLEDKEKTTYTYPFGMFAYRHMPFRLCNALDTFQRCMISIFSNMVGHSLEIFMDNFSVFGSSFEECLHHLTLVLERCKKNNQILNLEKCDFMVKQGIVLGHVIS
jgi:hypothetical protein